MADSGLDPVTIMTLVIPSLEGRVLLGMKKRGFGVGRWNGFGGKVKVFETIEEAAKRELFEECGIRVREIKQLGVLNFSFENKVGNLKVHIFKAVEIEGQPQESEEMMPRWFGIDEIPFTDMWPDDKFWIPSFFGW